ncbi:MAG: transposase [Bacteroidales bacterium]|nr:transposase [Bacteroidales bacterium]
MEQELKIEIERFSKRFANDESCLKFLEQIKWEEGFVCPNCGHTNYCKGATSHSRRCTRCKKDISPMANTLFHRCRIPLTVAFKMAYLTCKFPDISSYALNKEFNVRRMTCYNFQRKVRSCLDEGKHDIFVKALVSTLSSGTDRLQSDAVDKAGNDKL